MNKQTSTAYSVLFRNEDGSLRGTSPGSTPECAIRAANPLEGREVFGFAAIRVEPEPISGMRFVLREVGPKAEPVVLTPSPKVDEVRGGWQPMETAPDDGTMVRLLVDFTEHSTEDSIRAVTIGAYATEGDPPGAWQFAGWCWTHDHFTEGKGTPVGWMPMLDDSIPQPQGDAQ